MACRTSTAILRVQCGVPDPNRDPGKSSPMEDALLETWEGQFENVADHTDDAKTLFFVELVHADFKIDLKIGEENEKIEVIRW